MDFEEILWKTAVTSKQLEAKWFFDANGDGNTKEGFKTEVHRMPFQRRNLSYCKGMQYRGRRKWKAKQQRSSVVAVKELKQLDLLFDVWKHRVRKYNDAFLTSPRRATRNYAATTTPTSDKKEEESVAMAVDGPKLVDLTATTQKETDVATLSSPEKPKAKEATSPAKESKATATTATEDSTMTDHQTDGTRLSAESVANLVSEPEGSSLGSSRQKLRTQQPKTKQPVGTISELDEESLNAVVTWSKQENNNNQGELIDPQTKVLFHFSYFDAQEQLCFQTDTTPDNFVGHRRCLFCYFNGGSDTGLLMHCVTSHSERLDFSAARSEDGTLHISVSKKHVPLEQTKTPRDFVYVRRPTTGARSVPSVPFVKRLPAEVARLDVQTRRRNMRLLSETGADENAIKQFLPNSEVAVRQYYHSRSNEPMLKGAWDVDSDDEEDEEWLTKMSEELLDEFDDVNSSEKRFTKLWNRFMKCHTVVADQVIPAKCAEFVDRYSQALVEQNLRQELLLHFTGLWDAGLISAAHLKDFMADFDKVKMLCSMIPRT